MAGKKRMTYFGGIRPAVIKKACERRGGMMELGKKALEIEKATLKDRAVGELSNAEVRRGEESGREGRD